MSREELVSASSAPHAALKVLVVDDHDGFRDSLQEIVQALGYECRSARNGAEAWEMHQMEPADVILSDWQMPRMNGIELCQRVRAGDGAARYTHFILLTGLEDKAHFLRALDAGADACQSKCIDPHQVRAYLCSAARIVSLHRKLAAQARTDPLTGTANRLRMDEDLASAWSHVKRYHRPCSVAICDVDEFKKYNDHFGHLAGDELLRRIARTIRRELRDVDGVYRYGGEEFLILLPEQSLPQAAHAVNRVRTAIAHLAVLSSSSRRIVSISAGVAEVDLSLDGTVEAWLRRADAALYRAKAQGRNRVECDKGLRRIA